MVWGLCSVSSGLLFRREKQKVRKRREAEEQRSVEEGKRRGRKAKKQGKVSLKLYWLVAEPTPLKNMKVNQLG